MSGEGKVEAKAGPAKARNWKKKDKTIQASPGLNEGK